MQTWLVTGGAGFIGSNFVLAARAAGWARIVNLDLLTYAGHRENLASLDADPGHVLIEGDIRDDALVARLLVEHQPAAVVHFAAESHVDRSILGSRAFVETNVLGTHSLLEAARVYFDSLTPGARAAFRFLHVSTDEVYGTLGPEDPPFNERNAYRPRSPYAASKAGSDHLASAWHETYGLPVLITHCTNNYGPFQHPEKLIPLMIQNALAGQPLPVYGDGRQVRDWLHVSDHVAALRRVLAQGRPGETYCIGGEVEVTNIEIIHALCAELDRLRPAGAPHARLIQHVTDRPGHDRRYAMDISRMRTELGWQPRLRLSEGLAATVRWYLDNADWVKAVCHPAHRDWMARNYSTRAGSA